MYGIILGFFATMMVYLGSGPGWANVHMEAEMCRSNWWKNLLYINIYFPDDGVRTSHSSYLNHYRRMELIPRNSFLS